MKTLDYNKIKDKVGNKWALIFNPRYSEKDGKLEKGILAYFDEDKQNVYRYLNTEDTHYKHFAILYFGEFPDDQLFLFNIH